MIKKNLFLIAIFSSALLISCGDQNKDSSFCPTLELDGLSTTIELDISKNNTLDYSHYLEKYPSLVIESLDNKASIDNGVVTFPSVGSYSLSLSSSHCDLDIDNAYIINVYVYNLIRTDGDGTIDNPYLIDSAEDLVELNEAIYNYKDFKNKFFKQTCDISLSNYDNWNPVGSIGVPFEGIYDGDNHSIADLNIESSDSYLGVFGFSTGIIKNLNVYGNINCLIDHNYIYTHSFAGGVVGAINNGAIVDNCVNYVNIFGHAYVGGVVGASLRADDYLLDDYVLSKITNCTNYGKISGNDDAAIEENAMYFGGVTGYTNGVMYNCVNYGDVKVTGEKAQYVGGIAGITYIVYKYGMDINDDYYKYASINCVNHGDVYAHSYVGGISGSNSLPLIECENDGTIMGGLYIGGISGVNGTNSVFTNEYAVPFIEDCENNGQVMCYNRSAGGISGYSFFDIRNCINNVNIVGLDNAYQIGGIAGMAKGACNILECENTGHITGLTELGGIVARYEKCSCVIKDCINNADVEINKEELVSECIFVGGIVGMLGSSNSVDSCVNYGNVRGGGRMSDTWGGVGGIAGSLYIESLISNSDNYGNVEGICLVGGIVGFTRSESSEKTSLVYNCVNKEGCIINVTGEGNVSSGCIAGRCNYTIIEECKNYGSYIVKEGQTDIDYICGVLNSSSIVNSINYYEVEL